MKAKYMIDEKGNKKEIVIPIKTWLELMEELQDYQDAMEADKIMKDKHTKYYSWEEVRKDLYAS